MANKLIKIQNLNITIVRNTSGCSLTSQIQTGWIWYDESTTKTLFFVWKFQIPLWLSGDPKGNSENP